MKNPAEGQKSDGTELADYRSNLARSVRSMLDEFSRARKSQVEMARNERRAALLEIRNQVTDIRNGSSRASEEEKVHVDDFFKSMVTGIQAGSDSAIMDEAPTAANEVQETPVSIETIIEFEFACTPEASTAVDIPTAAELPIVIGDKTEAVQPEAPKKEELPGEVFQSAKPRKKTGSKSKQPKRK